MHPYDADMPTASSDEATTLSAPFEPPRPGFCEREAAELAEEAKFGGDGQLAVERVQGFYRQVFELVGEEVWPDDPVGPLGTLSCVPSGVPNRPDTLMNVGNVLSQLMGKRLARGRQDAYPELRTVLRPPDDHAYEEASTDLEVSRPPN